MGGGMKPWLGLAAKIRLTTLVIVIGGWEIWGRNADPLFMVPPSKIVAAAMDMSASGELWAAAKVSMMSLLCGYFAAAILGVLLGLIMGRYRPVEWAMDMYITALYATPLVALIPLIILWLGTGFAAKVTIVFFLSIFPVLINTATGVKQISRSLVDVGHAFCCSERQIFTKIVLPASVPFIMSGLRISIGRAIIALVVAEFQTALTGLGASILQASSYFRTDKMFVPVLLLMFFGVGMTELSKLIERRIAPWKETESA